MKKKSTVSNPQALPKSSEVSISPQTQTTETILSQLGYTRKKGCGCGKGTS
ncbi:hypothetical protein PDQ79_33855 [Bacillus cereus]|nr:hypothetical protein [Bacillus cereus]